MKNQNNKSTNDPIFKAPVPLFRPKPLVDLSGLPYVKSDKREIANSTELDKAIGEVNWLHKKKAELREQVKMRIAALTDEEMSIEDQLNDLIALILSGIRRYYDNAMLNVDFVDMPNGEKQATVKFDHGEVVITKSEKTRIQIKPAKPSPAKEVA